MLVEREEQTEVPKVGVPEAPSKCFTPGTQDLDERGNCNCKANANGPICERCRYDSFDGPRNEHPGGCLSCWCAHMSDKCDSSDLRYSKVPKSKYSIQV